MGENLQAGQREGPRRSRASSPRQQAAQQRKEPQVSDRIVNTHDQLQLAKANGLPDVAIMTHHSQGTRDNYRDGWMVVVPGADVSEGQKQHWSEYIHSGTARARLFHRYEFKDAGNWRAQDNAAFAAAVEWCKARFPEVVRWRRNRFGDYVDVGVNARWPIPKPQAREVSR
jgi:hypothetical protein